MKKRSLCLRVNAYLYMKRTVDYLQRAIIKRLPCVEKKYVNIIDWEQDGVLKFFFFFILVHGSSSHGRRRRARSRLSAISCFHISGS